ncbi:11243_t:CDS:10 [Acaulospora colombiana]|uniref:11243_t:CDS:1 n=1 Tax=Acaulospora colombiana TaxID=27376 RepID=A0ACA9JV61_9GLOM|nr:11243_t:CDS:10 [Acaulospora colombiana]
MHVKFAAVVYHDSTERSDESKDLANNPDEIKIDLEEYIAVNNPDEIVMSPGGIINDSNKVPRTLEEDINHREEIAVSSEVNNISEILDFPDANGPLEFSYDEEWLAITKATHEFLSLEYLQIPLPSDEDIARRVETDLQWVRENITKKDPGLLIPNNFQQTAPNQDELRTSTSHPVYDLSLITDSPTTFGMLLSLGGDITKSESTLQPVIQITIPQIFRYLNLSIAFSSSELRIGIISFMLIILKQYPRSMMDINSVDPKLAVDIIKSILKFVNDLPPDLDERDLECELFIEEGHAADIFSRIRDLLFQRASIEEIRALIKAKSRTHSQSVAVEPLCKAFVSKVHDVIISVQQQSNFSEITITSPDDTHDIEGLLASIHPRPLHWSSTTLGFFPEPLRSHLAAQQLEIGDIPSMGRDVILLEFPPSKMASYTIILINFIVEMIEDDPNEHPVEVCYQMLDELIWRYQILAFEHVLFALVRGHSETNATAFGILDYLLFKSEGFSERVSYFISLKFSHRYWVEDDHHDKLMKYLERYPEYFQYEAYAMDGYEMVNKPLEPPLDTHMPIYYTNSIRKSLPILDIVIGRLVEFGEQKMLIKLLDEYGHPEIMTRLIKLLGNNFSWPSLAGAMLSTNRNFFHYLFSLNLDYDEYDIDSELRQYGSLEIFSEDIFEITYFEKVFHKLAESMPQEKYVPKADTNLPERHFREIPNPTVLALHVACIEILAIPTSPEEIVKATLDMIIRANGRKKISLQPVVIHAVGLLYSFLPTEEFVYKVFDEMVMTITTDPHLREFSQEYNLKVKTALQLRKIICKSRYCYAETLRALGHPVLAASKYGKLASRLRKPMDAISENAMFAADVLSIPELDIVKKKEELFDSYVTSPRIQYEDLMRLLWM